jgi:DNA polymerase-4
MLSVNWLFLDMNSFFASVEQQLQPKLRGKPVAVVPVMTNRTCCIAASYEARAYGVKTGTNVGDARQACPAIRLVLADHENYIRIHHQIIAAVETVLPVEKVCSIDEMVCQISPHQRELPDALKLAERVKEAIYNQVGEHLRCSIGLATNRFLAKVASNLQKPNGLSYITRNELPYKLYRLSLTDLPGIARGMQRRLNNRGILTMQQLCSLSKQQMADTWESVLGEQWWHWLRGDDYADVPTHRRTVGHSHVLAPEFRTDLGARGVIVRLIHKAASRLRRLNYWTRRMKIGLKYSYGWPSWHGVAYLSRCQDTPTMLRAFEEIWAERPLGGTPLQVSIVLWDMTSNSNTPLPLFAEERRNLRATQAMDKINEQIGPNSVYFASMHAAREQAPMRIAFTHIPDITAESEGHRRKNP